jgi:dTDP-4-dehydrorhamnose reductase
MKSEEVALENSPNCLIFRLSWLYGNSDNNFLAKLEQWRKSSDKLKIVNDEISIPTSVEFVVQMSLMGINNNLSGVYNLTPTGYCSRYEWAKLYFEILEKDVIIYPCSIKEFPSIVTRPKFSAMDNTKIYETLKVEIPHWSSVLEKYLSRLLITSDKQTKVVRKIRYDTGITPIEEDL